MRAQRKQLKLFKRLYLYQNNTTNTRTYSRHVCFTFIAHAGGMILEYLEYLEIVCTTRSAEHGILLWDTSLSLTMRSCVCVSVWFRTPLQTHVHLRDVCKQTKQIAECNAFKWNIKSRTGKIKKYRLRSIVCV